LVVELRDRMPVVAAPADVPAAPAGGTSREDLLSALLNLGYSRGEAEKGVERVLREGGDGRFEDLLRRALRAVAGR
jgi:Holliday junction resolvasome RuvABC DNA-binding subunit